MSYAQFLSILKARWVTLVATFLTVVVLTVGISLIWEKQYTATTTVLLDFKGVDPVLGISMPAQLMPAHMATQVDIIESHKVALEVVKALKLAESPQAKESWMRATQGKGTIEDWLADVLLRKLDVKPSRESSLVGVSFTGSDPRFAAVVADAFAQAYQRTNVALRVEPAKESAAFFDEQLQALRKDLEGAQQRLAEYQQKKGMTSADERMDIETSRLSELSQQYTMAQAQVSDAVSRQRQLNEFLVRGASPETLPDVLGNSLIQNQKSILVQTEAKLQQTSSQLGVNHPEVRRLEADIASQRARLKAEINTVAQGIGNTARIAQKRADDLRNEVARQKSRLLSLNAGRDELMVLMKEVDSAQKAYDGAAARYQQTNLERQANQTNISILTRAVPPLEPSYPKVALNTIISIIVGLALGVLLALLREMLDRRVRTVRQMMLTVPAPVLGVLENDRAARRTARRWVRRGAKAQSKAAATIARSAR